MKKLLFLFLPIIFILSCTKETNNIISDTALEMRGPSNDCYLNASSGCIVSDTLSDWDYLPTGCDTIFLHGDFTALGDLPAELDIYYFGYKNIYPTSTSCPDDTPATITGIDLPINGSSNVTYTLKFRNLYFERPDTDNTPYVEPASSIVNTYYKFILDFTDCILPEGHTEFFNLYAETSNQEPILFFTVTLNNTILDSEITTDVLQNYIYGKLSSDNLYSDGYAYKYTELGEINYSVFIGRVVNESRVGTALYVKPDQYPTGYRYGNLNVVTVKDFDYGVFVDDNWNNDDYTIVNADSLIIIDCNYGFRSEDVGSEEGEYYTVSVSNSLFSNGISGIYYPPHTPFWGDGGCHVSETVLADLDYADYWTEGCYNVYSHSVTNNNTGCTFTNLTTPYTKYYLTWPIKNNITHSAYYIN